MRRERLTAGVTTAWTLALLLVVAPASLAVATIALAYVRAARDRRARREGCPFEDDDHDARPAVREAVDVVCESATLLRLLLAGLAPVPRRWRVLVPEPGNGPVVVLLAERGLPRSSLLWLGRRLAAELGASVHVEPAGGGDVATRADRLVGALAAGSAALHGRALVLVGHGAGGLVARRVAATLRGGRLHVVTLATAHRGLGETEARDPVTDRAHVLNVYSLHDALVVPAERAYLAGAYNVALRDEGHFGIVTGERPCTIVLEELGDLAARAAAS